MLRSKKQTYLINQSNFTSRNFQNRKLPILFSRVQNSPRGGAAQLATIQQARRAPTRFFLSVVAYCPPSPLPLTREKKKPKVPGSEGGVDYPRADSRVGNYSFRGEGGASVRIQRRATTFPYLFIPGCRLLAGWVSANANGIAS